METGSSSTGGHERQRRGPLIALLAASVLFTLGDGSVQVLLSPHLQAQGATDAVIGPIFAVYSGAALCFRFVTGAVYRADRIRWLVAGGCLLQSAAFLGIANAADPLLLSALVAVNGVGFAVASTGGLAAVMELRQGANAGVVMSWYTGCIGLGYAGAGFTGGIAGDLLGLPGAITALSVIPLLAALGFAGALRRPSSALTVEHANPSAARSSSPRRWGAGALGDLRRLSPMVLLAFACALHVNLFSGVLHAFFPLYGLAIGLSLTQIGALTGLHSGVSASVRFLAPVVFKRVAYQRLLPWMVGLGSLSVAALVISPRFWMLGAAWAGIGLSRGLLRVSSAALVMDAAGGEERQRGAASGVYMAGLDIGRIIGPLAGGFTAEAFGYATTLLLAGLAVPIVFFVLWFRLRASTSALDQKG